MAIDCRRIRLGLVFSACLAAAACGGDDGPTASVAKPDPTPSPGPSVGAPPTGSPSNPAGGGAVGNSAPVITGTPLTAVVQETPYSFQPDAADPDGDALTFKVATLPGWASFSPDTGLLHGTPSPADIGQYGNIVISVSDGEAESALGAFDITVTAIANGAATLTWMPPTENTDGTPLTDLAGYKLYWGTSSGVYPSSVTIDNPGVTTFIVENLVPATYYFVATAFNAEGSESEPSNEAVSTVL